MGLKEDIKFDKEAPFTPYSTHAQGNFYIRLVDGAQLKDGEILNRDPNGIFFCFEMAGKRLTFYYPWHMINFICWEEKV